MDLVYDSDFIDDFITNKRWWPTVVDNERPATA